MEYRNEVSYRHCCDRFKLWQSCSISTGELIESLLVHLGTECRSKIGLKMLSAIFSVVGFISKRWCD